MRVTLNLATRPYADFGPILLRLRIAIAVLAVVALGLGLGLYAIGAKAAAARTEAAKLDHSIARVQQERQGYQALMKQPENAAVLTGAENLNQLIDQKAFSWTLAMEDLERVLPGGVQATTLEPTRDPKTGEITLKLRVLGPRDRAIELVQNLEHSRRFVHPRIAGESEEATSGPNQRVEPVSASSRVNFEVVAEYVPPAPDERTSAKPAAEPSPASIPSAGIHRVPSTGPRRGGAR